MWPETHKDTAPTEAWWGWGEANTLIWPLSPLTLMSPVSTSPTYPETRTGAWLMQPIEVNALGPSPKAENDGRRHMENKSTIINYECGLLGSNRNCRVMKRIA